MTSPDGCAHTTTPDPLDLLITKPGGIHKAGADIWAMSSARRASEDARFRAFLSSHFDAQTYVTNVIREGRGEECFAEMTSNIVEVNYIMDTNMLTITNACLRLMRKLRAIYLFTSTTL